MRGDRGYHDTICVIGPERIRSLLKEVAQRSATAASNTDKRPFIAIDNHAVSSLALHERLYANWGTGG
ncbi:hypothetical protein EVAR_72569_1 [Eumeta japonica]|uniref:Uncharacterized protein n=1 Tax=Eumeta variegata TaxID=151549 RepID=A0A4C1SZC2_EUMVA|nr:hypothetical protein EVAR_72569_1 [Eumeta japonica]